MGGVALGFAGTIRARIVTGKIRVQCTYLLSTDWQWVKCPSICNVGNEYTVPGFPGFDVVSNKNSRYEVFVRPGIS